MSTCRMRRIEITIQDYVRGAQSSRRPQRSIAPAHVVWLTVVQITYAAVHLHDEGSREGAPSRRKSSRRHLAVVSSGRKDRRARPERRREELAAQNHGGGGHELPRRSL